MVVICIRNKAVWKDKILQDCERGGERDTVNLQSLLPVMLLLMSVKLSYVMASFSPWCSELDWSWTHYLDSNLHCHCTICKVLGVFIMRACLSLQRAAPVFWIATCAVFAIIESHVYPEASIFSHVAIILMDNGKVWGFKLT